MEGWILEYAATFRKKNILASYANGRKLSSLGCPQMPLMCAFLSSAVEKEEYEYYEKAIDVLWELYKVIPHLIPFQEFGNLILDIKIQKMSLTMCGMTDKNYSNLAEEIARLFKVPEGRDFQNNEDFVWFNRKSKEISRKMIRFVNDGKGNYELLSSFSQDIKTRVFEYVEKVNKKIGLTFVELFSRLSRHSHCKTKCELRKEVTHKSKKIKNLSDSKGSSMAQTSATDENLLCNGPVHCSRVDIHDDPSYDKQLRCQLSTDNQINKVPCLNTNSTNEPSSDTSEDLLVLSKAAASQTNIQDNSPESLCGTHSKTDGVSNVHKFHPGAAGSVMENACAKSEKESKSASVVIATGLSRNIETIPARRTREMISSQSDEESHTQPDCKRIKISPQESSTNAGNGEYSENFSESRRHCQYSEISSPVPVTNHMSSSIPSNTRQSISGKNPPVTQENVHEVIPRNIAPFKVKIEPQECDEFLWNPSTNPVSQNKMRDYIKRDTSLITGNAYGLPVDSHARSLNLERSVKYENIVEETVNHSDILGNGIMKVSEVPIAAGVLPGNNNGKRTCDRFCQTSLASSESSSSLDDELSSSLYSSTSEDLHVRYQGNSPKLSRTRSWKDIAINLNQLNRSAAASVMAGNARAKSEKEPKSGSVVVQATGLGRWRTCQMVSSQSNNEKQTGSNRKKISQYESFIVLGHPGKGYESNEMTSVDDCVIMNDKFRKRNVFQESDDSLNDTSNIRDSDSKFFSDEIFTPEYGNEPGSITRKKVGFCWRNSENRDFKHERNCDDRVSESTQLYSTTSDEDCFPELNIRCYVEGQRKNLRRSSRVSLAMRHLKRISRNRRLGKLELLDCVVVLEKFKVK